MSHLRIEGVSKRFRGTTVLDGIALDVAQGEFLSLLGPSGCGKTTLLRILAGLLPPDAGRVVLGGADVTRVAPHRRNVGVVFQNYALFPHLTVAENVAFGLRARGRPADGIPARVAELLSMVQLDHFAGRPTAQLSGGQQQRVAIARSLATGPDLLLLDEPLSALDRKLRETMQVELRRLLRQLGVTAIFVTHDQEEALALSDRIAVMHAGRIEQLAPPQAIYDRPATPFVMDFVGQATVLQGTMVDCGTLRTAYGDVAVEGTLPPGRAGVLAIRPERIAAGAPIAPGRTGIALPLAARTFLGSRCLLHGAMADGDRGTVELPASAAASVGDDVLLTWKISDGILFPADP